MSEIREVEDWAVKSNEALELTLLSPSGENPLTFHPEFTYPIFGNSETIYGYRRLKISLSLAGWDMRGLMKVSWSQKLDSSEVEDPAAVLAEYLSKGSIHREIAEFLLDIFDDKKDFKLYLANPVFNPLGELIDSYELHGNSYLVYRSSLSDPNTLAVVNRLQVFVVLLIEGGSYIDDEDDRWQIYIL
jgi:histone acetyltransferase 1